MDLATLTHKINFWASTLSCSLFTKNCIWMKCSHNHFHFLLFLLHVCFPKNDFFVRKVMVDLINFEQWLLFWSCSFAIFWTEMTQTERYFQRHKNLKYLQYEIVLWPKFNKIIKLLYKQSILYTCNHFQMLLSIFTHFITKCFLLIGRSV